MICFGFKRKRKRDSRPNYVIDPTNAEKSSVTDQNAFLHPDSRILGSVTAVHDTELKVSVPKPEEKTTVDFGFSNDVRRLVLERHTQGIPLSRSGSALLVEVYGAGNIPESILRQLSNLSHRKPVVAALQAHGLTDMTAYAAGWPALENGILPAAGFTTNTASKRLAFLVAHIGQIKAYARRKRLDSRKLFETLFMSGTTFKSDKVMKRHSDALRVPIIKQDLLVQLPFQEALGIAASTLSKALF